MGENGVGKHYYQGSGAAAAAMEVSTAEHGQAAAGSKCYDDDGRLKRTGTMWTASAHIITAVIGSGVLSLAWAIAQLGWVAGPAVMLLFSLVTYYTSSLLSDCYRSGDESTGKRNYTYMDAVNANLSGIKVQVCGFLQYADLVGVAIGYTIATYISMLFISTSSATMPSPHPRHCRGGEHLLDGMRNVRDWAPPGWHWEVVSGARRLVRNPGLAVDPELLWWRSRGSQSVQGEPAPEKVVRRRVMEEDKHVRRYMVALDTMFSNTWQVLQGSHPSYEFVMVPSLWVFTARGLAPGRRRV